MSNVIVLGAGMVGSAIMRKLKENGYKKLITIEKKKLDLTSQKDVLKFFKRFSDERF